MSFFLSKLVPLFVYPLGLALVLTAMARFWYRRPKRLKVFLPLVFFLLWLPATRFVADSLTLSLEQAYPYISPDEAPPTTSSKAGMTDEEEIGFFLKRARVAQQMLGDEHYHLQRYASLRGY